MCREALGAMRTTSLLCFLSLSSVLLLPAQPATPAFWKQVEIVIWASACLYQTLFLRCSSRVTVFPAVSLLVQCAVCPVHWSVLSGHVWLRACGTSTFEAVGIVNNLNNFEFQIRPRRFSLVRHGFVQETLRIRRPNLKEGDLGIRNSWRNSLQFRIVQNISRNSILNYWCSSLRNLMKFDEICKHPAILVAFVEVAIFQIWQIALGKGRVTFCYVCKPHMLK